MTCNDPVDIAKLKRILCDINSDQNISNLDKYGPMTTPILLVQVHRDVQRLQFLIFFLAQVRHIHITLLIFSHSYYDEKISRLIGGIDFCKVMQIFYPHSLQLHPYKFPGVDDEDCLPGAAITDCMMRDARSH
ncbi:jg1424 [Pararge aegeria aegeria]|uniref:Jg1424 protein n=1 Tax=Pararge aegeria aegeria TaxID=348720 RepID=A0A8S4RNF6_9NEOP|nr:jg1424 [Pararge aegeria aegeria]